MLASKKMTAGITVFKQGYVETMMLFQRISQMQSVSFHNVFYISCQKITEEPVKVGLPDCSFQLIRV